MPEEVVGKVTRIFQDQGCIAIISGKKLSVGDKLRFINDGRDHGYRTISSIELQGTGIPTAEPGQEVGIKFKGGLPPKHSTVLLTVAPLDIGAFQGLKGIGVCC